MARLSEMKRLTFDEVKPLIEIVRLNTDEVLYLLVYIQQMIV
jgi:hypothetical protein